MRSNRIAVLVLLLVALVFAMPAGANAISMKLVGTDGSLVRNGMYAGYYEIEVNGVRTLMFCDDVDTHIVINQTWQAEIYTYADVQNGAGKFNDGTPAEYSYAGWLVNEARKYDHTVLADRVVLADISEAIWLIMDEVFTTDPTYNPTAGADYWYNAAITHGDFNWSNVMLVYTPDPTSASQEFLRPIPEPATMLLVGSGLLGLAGFGRKKLFRRG